MACRRRALLLALITAASAFVRPVTHVRAARSLDVAAKKRKKGGKKAGGAAAGGLASLKVPQLKERCRAAGLPVGGTKAGDAKEHFGGERSGDQVLDPWERLAQALLISNEAMGRD